MKIDAKNISPEVVAAISAAVNMMVGNKVVAISIKRRDVYKRQNYDSFNFSDK